MHFRLTHRSAQIYVAFGGLVRHSKLRNQEAEFNTRIAEQRPVIENLTHIWRTVILAVIAAVILGMYTLAMTFSIPSVFALGQAFGAYWSGKTVILHQGVPISSPTPDK